MVVGSGPKLDFEGVDAERCGDSIFLLFLEGFWGAILSSFAVEVAVFACESWLPNTARVSGVGGDAMTPARSLWAVGAGERGGDGSVSSFFTVLMVESVPSGSSCGAA